MSVRVFAEDFSQDLNGPIDFIQAGHGKIEAHGAQAVVRLREEELPWYEGNLPLHRRLVDFGHISSLRPFDPYEHTALRTRPLKTDREIAIQSL